MTEGEEIKAGTCVIGAGPAGISLALDLAKNRGKVVLLESGDIRPEVATQALYAGELAGHSYAPYTLESSRLRYLGGSSNHWEGWCRPLDDIDFQQRSHVPHSGWPITRFTLASYYEAAQELCELGPYHYSAQAWLQEADGELPIDRLAFSTAMFQFSPPTRFGRVFREQLVASERIQTILNANAVELVGRPDSTEISSLRVATLGGPSFTVRAAVYVLAAGGIENARLLLASRGRGEAGLGNENDLVGRYFQDHPQFESAGFLASAASAFDGLLYREHARVGTRIRGVLAGTPSLMRREKLPNFCIALDPTSERFAGDLGAPLRDLAAAVDGPTSEGAALPRNFRLSCRIEQLPNPASRVVLIDELDALGVPRVRLNWDLQEADFGNLERAMQVFAREVGAAGLGRVKVRAYAEGLDWTGEVTPRSHQMGTTRMSDDPKRGVVDSDGKVHGIANVYVTGSAIFPTSGYADPTLSVVAVALRLGDHLREEFSRIRRRRMLEQQ